MTSRPITVLDRLERARLDSRGGLLMLIDPDRMDADTIRSRVGLAEQCGVTAILVGSSYLATDRFHVAVSACKEASDLPVVLFPGSSAQVSSHADAMLFMSLVSGRNPEFLIGEQVRAAVKVRRAELETIPTGYLLVESGRMTSVQFMSNTIPLPSDKPDIAVAHAVAAELLGLRLLYLEAGSGARRCVPENLVQAVHAHTSVPILVGGGVRTPEAVSALAAAGATMVVVGTVAEASRDLKAILSDMVAATRQACDLDAILSRNEAP